MGVVWKIAFRNLKEHKLKTLIIGTIVAIGITVLVVGNSLMDTATSGIRKTYIDNYTGHIVISGQHSGALSLFGSNSMDEQVPQLPEYEKLLEFVSSHPEVDRYSPQAIGQATVSFDEEIQGFVMLFGIDPAKYESMFPDNIELISGSFLAPGEAGIVLSQRAAKRLETKDGEKVKPGDKILLTGINMTGSMKIREVEVRGIFRFKQSDPQLNMVSLIDITNLRALADLSTQTAADIHLSEDEESLLGDVDENDLFGSGDDLFSDSFISDANASDESTGLFDILDVGEETAPASEPAQVASEISSSGAWHFLLLKLKNPGRTEQVRKELQKFFDDEGIPATTQGWIEGAGPIAKMTTGVKTVFNIIVLIVAVVAVIIIMNTLVISVTERIAEIGTMRAIGAQKAFVRKMITIETLIISGVFGLIGLLVGGAILWVLNLTGIPAPNLFFRVIFGGEVLRPVISMGSVLISLGVVSVIGVIASLYPVSIALKIQPVRAMQGS